MSVAENICLHFKKSNQNKTKIIFIKKVILIQSGKERGVKDSLMIKSNWRFFKNFFSNAFVLWCVLSVKTLCSFCRPGSFRNSTSTQRWCQDLVEKSTCARVGSPERRRRRIPPPPRAKMTSFFSTIDGVWQRHC